MSHAPKDEQRSNDERCLKSSTRNTQCFLSAGHGGDCDFYGQRREGQQTYEDGIRRALELARTWDMPGFNKVLERELRTEPPSLSERTRRIRAQQTAGEHVPHTCIVGGMQTQPCSACQRNFSATGDRFLTPEDAAFLREHAPSGATSELGRTTTEQLDTTTTPARGPEEAGPVRATPDGSDDIMAARAKLVDAARFARDAYGPEDADLRPGWWRFLDEALRNLDRVIASASPKSSIDSASSERKP